MLLILRKILNKIKWQLQGRHIDAAYKKDLKKAVKNVDFTIISNNCWGGNIYIDLQIAYNSPTAGLFFYAPCYLNFIKDLKNNTKAEIIELKKSKYEAANENREKHTLYYPIGLLNNTIEIHFLHYKTFEEAIEKWNRRCSRINYKNIFFAYNDKFLCTDEMMYSFLQTEHKNKVFFSSKREFSQLKNVTFISEFEGKGEVGDPDKAKYLFANKFNIAKWLNG